MKSLGILGVIAGFFMSTLTVLVQAQGVTPQPRKVVSFGPDDTWIRETAVAADQGTPGSVKLVASWISKDESTNNDWLGYAISHDTGGSWSDKDGQGGLAAPPNAGGLRPRLLLSVRPRGGF